MALDKPKYYSHRTQALANKFPSWMDLRNERSSVGQQFLNVIGTQIQDIDRAVARWEDNLFLSTADLGMIDILYKAQVPRVSPLDEDNPPTIIGDSLTITELDELNDFYYCAPPTRVTLVETTTTEPDATFETEFEYDIPHTDEYKTNRTLYFTVEAGQLLKYYLVDEGLEVPYNADPSREILGTYSLLDENGDPVTGTFYGAALLQDQLAVLYGQVVYFYDVRVPLVEVTSSGFEGNKDSDSLTPLLQATLSEDMSTAEALALDADRRHLWVQRAADWVKYHICFDYAIIDYARNVVFFREPYTNISIDSVGYDYESFNVFNALDEFGVFLDTPRLDLEANREYRARLLDVFKLRSNSTIQGVVDGISREVDLSGYGYHTQGDYPPNLFSDGIFPTGYNIFESGVYPDSASDIAKANNLMDPAFYRTMVDPDTNQASAEFIEYIKEVLRTFPLVWGSGENDPYGFIWDLSPFDGGLNSTNQVPDFFDNMASGLAGDYFQSGVKDPSSRDLVMRLIREENDNWLPQVRRGDFYIHNRLYHLSNEYTTVIPSGTLDFEVAVSGYAGTGFTILDPSGMEYLQVTAFTSEDYEYTVSGNHILFEEDHPELRLSCEPDDNPWVTLSGWDFNPTHSALEDGFIWIADEQQTIDTTTGYALTVNPDEIVYGISGSSVVIGRLLDTDGLPVTGALARFQLSNSNGTLSTTAGFTGIDGRVFALYTPPTTPIFASGVATSGYDLIIDQEITADTPTLLDGIWTVTVENDITGYPEQKHLMWLEKKETKELAISPTVWTSGSYFDGQYAGKYTISLSDDDSFNIRLDTIVRMVGGAPVGIPLLDENSPAAYAYDVDNYTDPQDAGKVSIYAAIIPIGPTNLRFDTYEPVKPVIVQPGVPTAGQSTITYEHEPDPAAVYLVAAPIKTTIESWATFRGTSTDHQAADVEIGFSPQQTGVFRIGEKFLNFLSYLRYA